MQSLSTSGVIRKWWVVGHRPTLPYFCYTTPIDATTITNIAVIAKETRITSTNPFSCKKNRRLFFLYLIDIFTDADYIVCIDETFNRFSIPL